MNCPHWPNVERLIEELDFHRVYTSHLSLYLGHREGLAGIGQPVLLSPTDRFDLLLEAAKQAMRQVWIAGAALQRMLLIASKWIRIGAEELVGEIDLESTEADNASLAQLTLPTKVTC